jgi:hypothetical protein
MCRGSSARKMTADQRTGSESTWIALPRVCRRPLTAAARVRRGPDACYPARVGATIRSTLAFGRRSRQWGHQRLRRNNEGRKPAGPRVRVRPRFYVQRSTGHMRTLARLDKNQSDVGKRQTWGDAPLLRASADLVVLTSTNCLGFRSSPSIRDRQNLASTARRRRRKPRRRNFTRAGCSECAVSRRMDLRT